MRKSIFILTAFIIASEIQNSLCFIDPISIGFGAAGAGLLTAGYHTYIKCRLFECCNDHYIPMDVRELQRQLATRLHGQHIVQSSVVRALNGYKATDEPPKALAISFHGSVGTGKNFVARMIGDTFFKKGANSQYYHYFSGSTYYASHLDHHKEMIKKVIVESLTKCERSMFVFDEVDMMPEGLLEVLQPFIDYGQPIFVEHDSKITRLTSNKSVFIFLSNKGSSAIMEQISKLINNVNARERMTIGDFEHAIAVAAFSEKGGFLNSNAIKRSLIDYYVPFLPLEKRHVMACMRDAFARRLNETPTLAMENEVMAAVTYFDPPYDLYSAGGCKRLEQKVISAVYQVRTTETTEDRNEVSPSRDIDNRPELPDLS